MPLSTLLAPFKNLHGVSGTIKIGLGRSKNETLNRQEIQQITNELFKDSKRDISRWNSLRLESAS